MKKKILISTGGSGGHVVPATILYNHLKDLNEVSKIIKKYKLYYNYWKGFTF